MFLYPRINQIIKDIDEWTDVLIARIEGKKVATNTVSSTWQERLGKQIDELIEKHQSNTFTNEQIVDIIFKNSSSEPKIKAFNWRKEVVQYV